MPKVSTQMRYDETLYEKAKIIAEREFRSVNAQIEYFIKLGIEAYESQNGVVIIEDRDEK